MKFKFASVVIDYVLTTWIIAKPGLIYFVLCVLVPFCPFVCMGITASVVTSSSTISNQLEAGSIIVRHIKSMSVSSLPLRVYGLIDPHIKVPKDCDDKQCREVPILVLVSFCKRDNYDSCFDMRSDGVYYTCPIHCCV